MSTTTSAQQEEAAAAATRDADELCVVCCKTIAVYSVGVCDHPVCYECSTRMRVVCRQNECPICRANLPQVVFSNERKLFKDLQPPLREAYYGIQFMTRGIRDLYYGLLEQVCTVCELRFKNFPLLREHMRRFHELHYCDLCVKHLLVFSFERKCYSRSALATHRRIGDPDNSSHRGHPLCEFCDERYMDSDHLFRHLRRDHLFCHLCDADGTNQYYSTYEELRTHFDEAHFLCQVGNCQQEMLTAVFPTEIDLKAHVAKVHGKQLGRAGTKQARTLEVEFNFTRRNNSNSNNHDPGSENVDTEGRDLRAHHGADAEPLFGPPRLTNAALPLSASDFPSLTGALEEAAALPARTTSTNITVTSNVVRPRFNPEEFPSLGSPSTGAVPRTPRMGLTSATRFNSSRGLEMNRQNFPTLWGGDTGAPRGTSVVKLTVQQQPVPEPVALRPNRDLASASSTSIQVRPKSSTMEEAFPALCGASSSCAVPSVTQWVAAKPKKQPEPKTVKVAKAPLLPPSSLAEFPSLEPPRKTERKSSSVTMPIRNNARPESSHNAAANTSGGSAKGGGGGGKKKDDGVVPKSSNNNEQAAGTSNAGNAKSPIGEKLVKKTSTLKIGALVAGDNNVASAGLAIACGDGSGGGKASPGGGGSKGGGSNAKGSGGGGSGKGINGGSPVKGGAGKAAAGKGGPAWGGGRGGTSGGRGVTVGNGDLASGGDAAAEIAGCSSGGGGVAAAIAGCSSGGGGVAAAAIAGCSSGGGGVAAVRGRGRGRGSAGGVQRPPPGFGGSNDLTFTSSSGQSYSIQPPGIPVNNYYPPPSFHHRNSALIQRLVYALRTQHVVDEFKSYSMLYREGQYGAAEYYALCVASLGADFDKLFPELLVLLPHIGRQHALFRVHAASRKVRNLDVCVICQQVIFSSEVDHHLGSHFPGSRQD